MKSCIFANRSTDSIVLIEQELKVLMCVKKCNYN